MSVLCSYRSILGNHTSVGNRPSVGDLYKHHCLLSCIVCLYIRLIDILFIFKILSSFNLTVLKTWCCNKPCNLLQLSYTGGTLIYNPTVSIRLPLLNSLILSIPQNFHLISYWGLSILIMKVHHWTDLKPHHPLVLEVHHCTDLHHLHMSVAFAAALYQLHLTDISILSCFQPITINLTSAWTPSMAMSDTMLLYDHNIIHTKPQCSVKKHGR